MQSLMVKAQREELDAVGLEVGTPVVYLKAAWSEPVLYGGRGLRTGCDIDVLVRPDRFEPFLQAMQRRGYTLDLRDVGSSWDRHHGKEMVLLPPPGRIIVDVHRRLADRPWFDLPADPSIDRATSYPSVDGEILSLAPEDQILYGAAHYAGHHLSWDGRHAHDLVLLLATTPVDWTTIERRANGAWLTFTLVVLAEALRRRGAQIPRLRAEDSRRIVLQRRVLQRWMGVGPDLARRRLRDARLERLIFLPLLTDRPTALARYLTQRAWLRGERLLEAARHALARS